MTDTKAFIVTWVDFDLAVCALIDRNIEYFNQDNPTVYGIPSGGSFVAKEIQRKLGRKVVVLDKIEEGTFVVDDVIASGGTIRPFFKDGFKCDVVYRKKFAPEDIAPDAVEVDEWITFPWDHVSSPESNVIRVLEYLGEDPMREGLLETPARYLKGLKELTEGYKESPSEILSKRFTQEGEHDYDGMVIVKDIPFWSLCEHHVLPFHGTAAVAYIPGAGGQIVGLSKLSRLVVCYAKRLQVQERLTEQIAHAMDIHVEPMGVGVIVKATHQCMCMRGVKSDAETVTSCLLGEFRNPEVRSEFLDLATQ